MEATIAFSTPFLREVDGAPMLVCDYAVLPSGTMFDAKLILYGLIATLAYLSDGSPALMRGRLENDAEIFPAQDGEAELIEPYAMELCERFGDYLGHCGLIEKAASS